MERNTPVIPDRIHRILKWKSRVFPISFQEYQDCKYSDQESEDQHKQTQSVQCQVHAYAVLRIQLRRVFEHPFISE